MQPPHPDAEHRAFLAEGRFMLQRDAATGVFHYPPRAIAPGTGAEALEWVEASGRGVVYSTTVAYRKPPEPNYNVALVDLAEGPRVMSRVDGVDPRSVTIGMAVVARIVDQDGTPLLVFTPEAA